MNRTPVGRSRCSLDVRPASGSVQQPRRLSVDLPLRSLGAFNGVQQGGRTVSGQLATGLRAIAEAHNGSAPADSVEASLEDVQICRLPRVLIAGAGIGGLVLAVALLKRGFRVQIFERDLTAVRGEGKYRGPIQVRPLPAWNGRSCMTPSRRWRAKVAGSPTLCHLTLFRALCRFRATPWQRWRPLTTSWQSKCWRMAASPATVSTGCAMASLATGADATKVTSGCISLETLQSCCRKMPCAGYKPVPMQCH